MSSEPRLTIGLPVFNGARYLAESLEALLGQSFGDYELIISDNASTDETGQICQHYAAADARIRYVRQPRNLGLAGNHNFVVRYARGELFKWASHDDLYARHLLKRCVAALDAQPDAVLAAAWTALIDESGKVTRTLEYPLSTASPRASERFRSLLFDVGGDDDGAVHRTEILRRVLPYASHYHSDRTLIAALSLQGPFLQVPDWLYYRRDHAERMSLEPTIRSWCTVMDPRRADPVRHPVPRLIAEYVAAYGAAIRRAPLTRGERWECYRHLASWVADRSSPSYKRRPLTQVVPTDSPAGIVLNEMVPGRAGTSR